MALASRIGTDMRNWHRYKWILIYLFYVVLVIVIAYLLAIAIGISDISDILALIQVVIDVLIVIPAVFAFIWQLVIIQSIPDFDLKWNIQVPIDNKEPSLELPTHSIKTWNIQPILVNNGNSVTAWYLVSFLIPEGLVSTFDDFKFHPVLGKMGEHWKCGYVREEDKPGYFVFTFLSNGQIASYPNYDLILATLEIKLYPEREYRDSYEVQYVITADKGKRKDKTFILKTHRENLAKKISPEAFLDTLLRFNRYTNEKKVDK